MIQTNTNKNIIQHENFPLKIIQLFKPIFGWLYDWAQHTPCYVWIQNKKRKVILSNCIIVRRRINKIKQGHSLKLDVLRVKVQGSIWIFFELRWRRAWRKGSVKRNRSYPIYIYLLETCVNRALSCLTFSRYSHI